jgi:hypothetical protein
MRDSEAPVQFHPPNESLASTVKKPSLLSQARAEIEESNRHLAEALRLIELASRNPDRDPLV